MNECLNCKKEFMPRYDRPNQKYCSKICSCRHAQLGKTKKKGNDRKKGSGGLREKGGRSKVHLYINWLGESMKLNNEEIKLAKILDEKHLNWKRNWKGFSYIDLNENRRKFYPDFVINESSYIEYKGWLTDKMRHKMKDAQNKNNLDLIIVVGDDTRFKNDGISIKQFEQLKFLK